jgi:A/G-specific adenine glycosylase
MTEIKKKIRDWYRVNRRKLPWRETGDPYRIWVSEIILQQTRVDQGKDYYLRFLEKFPNLESLARAEEDEVLKVWEGLGYYSRARNMHAAAKHVFYRKEGRFPGTYSEILELKGVGPYTAAAVASMAFQEPRAVIDGNVHRVLSRLSGIEETPGNYRTSSRITREADKLLDEEDPGTHNQAIMELGALVCTPVQPACDKCPLKDLCHAYKNNRTAELPVRAKPQSRRTRYFHYLVFSNGQGIWLGSRRNKDIWQGLYEFPLIETSGKVSTESLMKTESWSGFVGRHGIKPSKVSVPVKHVLSHQEIQARFYHIRVDHSFSLPGFKEVGEKELDRYPVPKLIRNYLDGLRD